MVQVTGKILPPAYRPVIMLYFISAWYDFDFLQLVNRANRAFRRILV